MLLQVKTNFLPLKVEITKLVLMYYNGFFILPNSLEIKQEGVRIAGIVRNEA